MEIERKFLIETKMDIAHLEYDDIIQGYVCLEPEIRVRKKGDKYYRTDKSNGEMVREETETEIPLSVYNTLMENREGGILTKRRYYMPYGKYTIEIDEYKGGLKGLVTAEVEFSTVEEANAFIPPDFLGTEVTFDKRYKNKNLASSGKIPDLQD